MMKARKPKWFFIGFHSDAESKSHSECSCSMSVDFRYSPIAIATTRIMDTMVKPVISAPAALSFAIL